MFEAFHLSRPEWLWLAPVLPPLLWWLSRRTMKTASMETSIAAEFIPFLTTGTQEQSKKNIWIAIGIGWLLAVIALSGPSWRQLPQPVEQQTQGLVIILDLSLSMDATDLKPSRLARAKHKLTDILREREEGLTGLVTYSGSAHVVTPLTDDADTILSLAPQLSTAIMPNPGSRVDLAIDQARKLFAQADLRQGRILLITDGIGEKSVDRLIALKPRALTLSVLAVGTEQGGPIPLQAGGLLKAPDGAIVIPKLDSVPLAKLADRAGGVFTPLSPGDQDLRALNLNAPTIAETSTRTTDRQFDVWQDEAHWWVLLILPLALLGFRRGIIFCAFLVVCSTASMIPTPSYANEQTSSNTQTTSDSTPASLIEKYFLTPDQRGKRAFDAEQYEQATTQFTDHAWKGSAHYRSGNYQAALDAYNTSADEGSSADKYYNQANTHAHLQQWDQALAAYEQALALDPSLEDAAHNKALIESLLEQLADQQQNQQNSDQNEQDSNQSSDGENQSSDNNSSKEGNNNSEQNASNESNADNQNSEQQEQSRGDSSNSELDNEQNPTDPSTAENTENESDPSKQSEIDQPLPNTEDTPEQTEEQQRATAQAEPDPEADSAEANETTSASAADTLTPEQRKDQAYVDRWLQQLPEQPSVLLRNKFYLQSERAKQNQRLPDTPPEQEYW